MSVGIYDLDKVFTYVGEGILLIIMMGFEVN